MTMSTLSSRRPWLLLCLGAGLVLTATPAMAQSFTLDLGGGNPNEGTTTGRIV